MQLSKFKKVLFLLSTLVFSINVSAQENFTNGFVVSLNGDTTKGLINYKSWRVNPKSIEFIKSGDRAITTFTPKDISSFGITLAHKIELYKSAKVIIESSSMWLDRMDNRPEFNDRVDQLFLLTLLKGSYALYVYVDEKEHYFIGQGEELTELKFKNYYLSDKSSISKNEQYKVQLIELFKNCPQITAEEIERLQYRSTELLKIFKKYNDCNGSKSENLTPSSKVKVQFGAIIATGVSSLTINNNQRYFKSTSVGNFSTGLSVALKLPRNNESSSINFELLYNRYHFEKISGERVAANPNYTYHDNFLGNYVRLNAMYRYQMTLVKLKPFFNIGLSNSIKISTVDKSFIDDNLGTATSRIEEPSFPEERNYEQGINLGFGINLKKINLELRAETTNGFTPYGMTKTNIKSLFLHLNYLF